MQSLSESTTTADAQRDPYAREWSPLLVVISGPSGVGKDTVLQALKESNLDFVFVVTMTTRARRANEMDGQDYFFVSHDTFTSMIHADELLEYSTVYGDYKGIPKDQVRRAWDSGKDIVMRIDVQGAAKIRAIVKQAVTIFLIPESEAELVRRLSERKTETPEGLSHRIATARDEMKRLDEFNYVVVNPVNQVDDAVEAIRSIIAAEHCSVKRTATHL